MVTVHHLANLVRLLEAEACDLVADLGDVFLKGAEQLIARIRGAQRAEGVSEILMPGERGSRERERALQEGIQMDDALMDELRRL